MKPSEYWRRQCKATFQYDRVGTKSSTRWASDDGASTTRTRMVWRGRFAHLPSDVTRKMTCENAGRFYGLIN